MRPSIAILILAVLVCPLLATAQGPESNVVVRIPASHGSQVARLTPIVDIDYGSYRLVELDAAGFDSLQRSNTPFTVVADARQVRVAGYDFDPLVEGEPILPEDLRAEGDVGFRLVQLLGPTKEGWLETLETSGAKVLQYYPHHTYLIWGSEQHADRLSSASFVRWQGRFHPAYKINADLAGRQGRIANVDIMFFSEGKTEATLAALRRLGATVLHHYPSQPDKAFWNAIVELDQAAVAEVARMPEVLWLGYESPRPTLDDEMSSQIVAGNYTAGVPFVGYQSWLTSVGLDGSGVVWAIIDTGVDYDHPDLNTRIIGGYSFPGACNDNPGDDCVGGGHGTHVAGIVGGDATAGFTDADGFLYGLGVAPGYGIFAMNSLSGTPPWPPVGGWQEHSKRAVLGGAVGGNNSWTTGEGTQHGYQASERTHDIMVRDGNFDTADVAEPFIEVFSAGNSGGSGLTAPKEGKNLIVTANSLNYRQGSIDEISGSSSRGPAVDGRWVPTVAAPGSTIASTRNDDGGSCSTPIPGTNNLYAFCSGTSMAAPHVSGFLTLITEWWRTANEGATAPSPAMAKALLVNSAVDMGTPDRPNINEGWGRIHLPGILTPAAPLLLEDQEILFTETGQQEQLSVGIVDPTEPLRVTIAWSDAPGAVGANPALVNNLDLTVETDGDTYLGNQFANGWSVTGGSPDVLNNLENVFVADPGTSATITIDATAIVGDGVPYNGDTTDQDFVIVCYNCAEQEDFTIGVTPGSQSVCAPSDAVYQVDVGSILGFNDPVTLDVTGQPAGTSVSFAANPLTPPDSTTLTIGNTGAATVGDYVLEVSGSSTTGTKSRNVDLSLFDVIPGTPTQLTPTNGATNVDSLPTFTWTEVAGTYSIEIATDMAFNDVVASASALEEATFVPATDLETSTTYYWRVWAENPCGTGAVSEIWSFTTEAAPGDCAPGSTPAVLFFDDLEGDTSEWSTGGVGSTWTLTDSNTHSGVAAFWAEDVTSISDQHLVTPSIAMPGLGDNTTLQFWNHQTIEDGGSGCFDGAVVEISEDGGSSWTRLESELLTDPYDGLVDDGYGNPLANENAWCGDPQDWLKSVVDIDAWAASVGEADSVRFRFRLATDSSVGRPDGWKIDDVKVQTCLDDNTVIFWSSFETGGMEGWSDIQD